MALEDLLERQRQILEETQMVSRWYPKKEDRIFAEIIELDYEAKTIHSESGYKPAILIEAYNGEQMYIFRNYYIDLILKKSPIQNGQKVCIEFFGLKKVKDLRYNTYGIIPLSDNEWETGVSAAMSLSTGYED